MFNQSHELQASNFQDCGPAYDDDEFGAATPEQEQAEMMAGALDTLRFQTENGASWEAALRYAALCHGVDRQELESRYNAPTD